MTNIEEALIIAIDVALKDTLKNAIMLGTISDDIETVAVAAAIGCAVAEIGGLYEYELAPEL